MRRTFLNLAVSSKEHSGTNFWSYLATYGHETPVLGTNHASDLTDVFFVTEPTFVSTTLQKYWLNFLYSLDPNTGISRDGNPEWPLYKNESEILSFNKNNVTIIKDEFRNDSFQVIQRNPGEFSQ
ncbi:hypothetical protein N7456_001208 [Penicillium angulare]|uniref:Carboxylesterase type B domain-containing protein n=1 Tax=Penicillium angulare TaxID=116970 RepID=A0A9W9GEL8_9EURO|nr:hypothetical protein N7456_001208 [Penicillium angulare]